MQAIPQGSLQYTSSILLALPYRVSFLAHDDSKSLKELSKDTA